MKRYNCTLSDKRGEFGECMEAHGTGRYVLFSDAEKLQQRMQDLLDKSNRTGVAIERAISTGSVLADHPLKSRLELLVNHHKREQVLAELLRRARRYVSPLSCPESEIQIVQSIVSSIDAVLAGKINFDLLMAAVHKIAPEGWQLVPVEPTTEMVEAYFAGKIEAQSCTHQQRARERVARDYRAMLAAAPKPQGGEPCDSASLSSSPD